MAVEGSTPSEEKIESASSAAGRTPCRSRSAMAAATPAAKSASEPGTGAGTARTCTPSGTLAPRLGESSATAAVTPW